MSAVVNTSDASVMNEYDSPSTRHIRESHAYSSRTHARESGRSHPSTKMSADVERREKGFSSYFDLKLGTVSSPTATLVADLSQNFHLGASPAVPTPRRSLMAQFSFHEEEAAQSRECLYPTTPHEDKSSPGELMDISPIPVTYRRSFARANSMFETQHQPTNSIADTSSRPSMRRPPLTNQRAFTAFAVPTALNRTGRHLLTIPSPDKENDLSDQFEQSPQKSSTKFFGNATIGIAPSGSPQGKGETHQRPPLKSMPMNTVHGRALPQFRRTQSMISKNDEFLSPELAQQMTPVLHKTVDKLLSPESPDSNSMVCQILPSFDSKDDQLKRITGATFSNVLDGAYKNSYDHLAIIDCRFPHEYDGGHIPHAINISSLDAMDSHPLLSDPQPLRTLIVLHCEYSAHRAPRIALHLRNRDRMMNAYRYPKLFYPEVYILDGGYSTFYKNYRRHVGGSGYVEMNDPSHKPFASKQMHNFRRDTKFQRTQSYTFGQESPLVGGARMEREVNFTLQERGSMHIESASTRSSSVAVPYVENASDISLQNFETDDESGSCSMMDIDDSFELRPQSTSIKKSTHNHYKSHTRTGSGRIDPRRLSSF